MKEFIKYFYNIKIDDYTIKDGEYYLKSGQKYYNFTNLYEDPIDLYKKYVLLKRNGMCCHDILFNRNREIVSIYDNKKYILLKEYINIKNAITMKDLYNSTVITEYNKKIDIKQKWEFKNDYYESILGKIYINSLKLALNFDYYLGLSELAVNLLSYVNLDNITLYAQHKRLRYDEQLINYYNPINVIIDSKIRDISFYIKSIFFEKNITIGEVESIIDSMRLNDDEAILFLSRMIYPDYYFDICDAIINENLNSDKLNVYIKKNIQYEIFLKNIYQYLYEKYNIPNVEWWGIKQYL